MMAAALGGSIDAVEYVLANGGSMSGRDIHGWTVMMFAARGGSVETMKYVLANGGSMNGVLRCCTLDEAIEFCQSYGEN